MNLNILDLGNNQISRVEGLATLAKVRTSHRRACTLPCHALAGCCRSLHHSSPTHARPAGPLPTLSCGPALQLTDLWLNDNQVGDLAEVESALGAHADTLSCVYLAGNPVAAVADYRGRLQRLLPRLAQLDDKPVD